MKKILISSVLFILVLALGGLWIARKSIISTYEDDLSKRFYEPILGFYDKIGTVKKEVFPVKHFTITWKNTGLWFDNTALAKTLNSDTAVFFTIETWSKNSIFSRADQNVIEKVIAGEFDQKTKELAQILSKTNKPVFVRWNPAMELPEYQYPWQFQSPPAYIKAFNHFATQLKKEAPNIKIVWGPAGYAGDSEYWPGEKLVDCISITLSEKKQMDSVSFHQAILREIKEKLHRMRFMNKPIIILGANEKMPFAFPQAWIQEASLDERVFTNTIYSSQNFVPDSVTKPKRSKMILGVYDPLEKLTQLPALQVEHLFTDWGEIQKGEIHKKIQAVVARKHDIILTVEPWKDVKKMNDPDVLQNVLKGQYDSEINMLYELIEKTPQKVYLRWAHEMEIPIHRYTWQSQDPVVYINAYRYFMLFRKNKPKNIFRVWGPAGDRGSIDWWPGDDVVDFISFAIYGLPDKNITDYQKQELFSDIFNRKFYRMRFANKPIFITEFGVKGPKNYQNRWMQNAAETLKNNKNVFGVSYFNQHDTPDAWGKIKAPDWSIDATTFQNFYTHLE